MLDGWRTRVSITDHLHQVEHPRSGKNDQVVSSLSLLFSYPVWCGGIEVGVWCLVVTGWIVFGEQEAP